MTREESQSRPNIRPGKWLNCFSHRMTLSDGLRSMSLGGRQGQAVDIGQHVDMAEDFLSTVNVKFNCVLF